ncbi:hypothetical protein Rs2_03855 [Raphanus sativus]|nr:hypothetical protein Rs2_03855 [Raphanus sativus]
MDFRRVPLGVRNRPKEDFTDCSARAGMSLIKLQNNAVKEFFTFTHPPPTPVLSYWPPNHKEFATGLTTPPVLLTNDGAVSYFFQHLALHENINLFVTFDNQEDKDQPLAAAEKPPIFFTPN